MLENSSKFMQCTKNEGVISAFKKAVRYTHGHFRTLYELVCWKLGYQLNPLIRTDHPHLDPNVIMHTLKKEGILLESYQIDLAAYNDYLTTANYPDGYHRGGKAWHFSEKSLEHYLSLVFLEFTTTDVFIDIAASRSPFADIAREMFQCTTYRQDINYHAGITGDKIGGNAADMPLPENFATKMSLHCSFEHFEGHNDIGFIREASRVLQRGGRVCILPLYLNTEYSIVTNPFVERNGLVFDDEAALIYTNDVHIRHGRFYHVAQFKRRILSAGGDDFEWRIYLIENEKEVDAICYVKFILLLERR